MRKLIPILVTACTALTLSLGAQAYQDKEPSNPQNAGVYVMDNNPSDNKLIFFKRRDDNRLARPKLISGSGLGAGDNAAADPLGSQNSVLLGEERDVIYMVNAGSDNISVFLLSNNGTPRLAQTIYSGGDFPVSLASDGEMLYVLNSGSGGAINGYSIRDNGLLTQLPNSLRVLGTGQEGDPVGGERNIAPGDISYDALSRRLTVAFGGGIELGEGKIFSYLLNDRGLPSKRPRTTTSQGRLPFSFAQTRHGVVLTADALGPVAGAPGSGIGGGISSYVYNARNVLSPVDTVGNGTIETCWIRVSDFNNVVYTTSTGSGAIGGYSVSRTGQITLIDAGLREGLQSPTDFAITRNGRIMYVVESGTGNVLAYRVRPNGTLRDIGAFSGLPTFENDGYAPQGLVVR